MMESASNSGKIKRSILGGHPFGGEVEVGRVPLFGQGRKATPFPHPWNYNRPLDILDTFFRDADGLEGSARHNRYLDIPGLPLALVTRDPAVIKAVLLQTGDKRGQFKRDELPARGIARFTGVDTMLYANGPTWRRQRKLAAPAMSRPSLFQPELFAEFEATFRATAKNRIESLRRRIKDSGQEFVRMELLPEISAVMLEMLINNAFGAEVEYEELRKRHVPSIEWLINQMMRDTIGYQYLAPVRRFTRTGADIRRCRADFEELTDIALSGRSEGRGLWAHFESEASDAALRGNVRVFLAGALEATTSFAGWMLSHISRRPGLQDRLHEELRGIDEFSPQNLRRATLLAHNMEETLRLTPSLYFLPRYAAEDLEVAVAPGRTLRIPKGTHVVLDVWHANRCDEFWGEARTGYPAEAYAPERWAKIAASGASPHDSAHFGFGHGPRVCPGKFLGQLEVALVVGGALKVFRMHAVNEKTSARAGVSSKPADNVLVDVSLR